MRASTFRIFALLLLKVDIVWCLIYNVTYDITNSTVTPDFPITWFPPDAWTADNNGLNSGGGARQTQVQGATMNFTFTGTAVYLTGVKAPTSSLFSVTIDNGPPQSRNISSENATIYWFRQMLFQQDGLSPTTHTFLANQSSATGSSLSLDTIIITQDSDAMPGSPPPPSTPAAGPSKSSSGPPASSTSPGLEVGNSQSKTQNNTGAIVGGVVAGVVALAALGVALVLWRRLRKVQSGERPAPAPEARLAAYAPVSSWEPPLNSAITFNSPHTNYNSGPSGSYAPSFGTSGLGSPEAANTVSSHFRNTPNAPFVEKPAPAPPPYMHT